MPILEFEILGYFAIFEKPPISKLHQSLCYPGRNYFSFMQKFLTAFKFINILVKIW